MNWGSKNQVLYMGSTEKSIFAYNKKKVNSWGKKVLGRAIGNGNRNFRSKIHLSWSSKKELDGNPNI